MQNVGKQANSDKELLREWECGLAPAICEDSGILSPGLNRFGSRKEWRREQMNNSSLRPIPVQLLRVPREAAWEEQDSPVCCALTEILTQPSHPWHSHTGGSSQVLGRVQSERKGSRAGPWTSPPPAEHSCQQFQWQEGRAQGCTEMYNLQGNWRQFPSQVWCPSSSLSSNPLSWEADWCCSWPWKTAGWCAASLQELSHFPFYLSQAHGQGKEGTEIYLHPTPCSGCNSSYPHMPGQSLCPGLCCDGKELQEGLLGSKKKPEEGYFSPFPIRLYLQHMLVVLSMQHSRNCCQGNTRLDLQGHEGICKLKQKEILFSKWSAQNVHEPSCEINWQCGIFKHGLMNCKHKATDRLRAPRTCPAPKIMDFTPRGLQEAGPVSKTTISTEKPCVKRQLLH